MPEERQARIFHALRDLRRRCLEKIQIYKLPEISPE